MPNWFVRRNQPLVNRSSIKYTRFALHVGGVRAVDGCERGVQVVEVIHLADEVGAIAIENHAIVPRRIQDYRHRLAVGTDRRASVVVDSVYEDIFTGRVVTEQVTVIFAESGPRDSGQQANAHRQRIIPVD